MWRESVDVLGIANLTQMEIEVDIYNNVTGKVEEIQNYKPDPIFPWKVEDANKPNGNNYKK